jgi:hypothetical protein
MAPLNVDVKIIELKRAISAEWLDTKDANFAISLCDWFDRKGFLSEKQEYWVDALLTKARKLKESDKGKTEYRPPTEVKARQQIQEQLIDAMKVREMFDKAKTHMKYPALTLTYKEPDNCQIHFFLCGHMSKTPGYIRITNNKKYGAGLVIYGDINIAGGLKLDDANCPPNIRKLILAFFLDPIGKAKVSGIEFRNCCFCGIELTTKESVAAGYGPICAENWGLPWGDLPDEEVKLDVTI